MAVSIAWFKSNALFGCRQHLCAPETSHPPHMLRMYRGMPICEDCYDDFASANKTEFHELEDLNPFEIFENEDNNNG